MGLRVRLSKRRTFLGVRPRLEELDHAIEQSSAELENPTVRVTARWRGRDYEAGSSAELATASGGLPGRLSDVSVSVSDYQSSERRSAYLSLTGGFPSWLSLTVDGPTETWVLGTFHRLSEWVAQQQIFPARYIWVTRTFVFAIIVAITTALVLRLPHVGGTAVPIILGILPIVLYFGFLTIELVLQSYVIAHPPLSLWDRINWFAATAIGTWVVAIAALISLMRRK